MKALKTLAVLALATGVSATASAATINVVSQTGTVYNTNSVFDENINGDEMAGMLVTATVMLSNGTTQVITRAWDPAFDSDNDHGGVSFGSPDFDLEVEGDTFDNGVWDLDFDFSGGSWRLISLAFDGGPGNTVFDRCWSGGTQSTNCNNDDGVEGTAGSDQGADFSNFTGWNSGTINVTYSNAVGLNGNAPVGDIFRNVLVLFGDGTFNNALTEGGDGDSSYAFRFDTDNARLTQPLATPEPGSMILLGTGLLGFAARMRRKKQ